MQAVGHCEAALATRDGADASTLAAATNVKSAMRLIALFFTTPSNPTHKRNAAPCSRLRSFLSSAADPTP